MMEYVRSGSTGRVSRICQGCLMLLFSMFILSSCTQDDTIGAGKTIIESVYSEETGETDNASRTQEDTIGASKPITESEYPEETGALYTHLTTSHFIRDIVNHPALEEFGNAMLPQDDNTAYYDTRLTNVASLLPYHSHVDPDIVVGAINHMINEVSDGKTIFYDFYADEVTSQ
ncbi:MAG: hypothetical protein JW934_08895 [Anaerolineae bacterium]|nr:hypothetical protein [Anaerolineae bacterium]